MSDSVRPHRRQPNRLPRPWDSPGKNTGVGCHFLLQCMKVKSESEVAQSCPQPTYQAPPSMGFSRQNTLLEHYISCCPSRQLPWIRGAARNPETKAGAPPPHLALTGANPSPPGWPQEQTPVDSPQAKVEIKPELKPRGSAAKEEDPKPSHQLYKLQIKSTWSTKQTLCLWTI